MKTNRLHKGILALLLLTFAACVMQGSALDKAKAFSANANHVWAAQYDAYQQQAKLKDLSDDQRDYLIEKRKVLIELYDLLEQYDSFLERGAVPSAALEATINRLIDRLIMEVM